MKKNKPVFLLFFLFLLLLLPCSCESVLPNPAETRIDAPPLHEPSQTDSPIETQKPPETTDTPASKEKRISFLAAGDNIIHEDVMKDAKNRAGDGEGYAFLPMYEGVASLIKEADIAFVNQEGPVGSTTYPYAGYPNFNAPPQAGDALVSLGFDIVNIANNHMLDCHEKGLLESIAYWETKDVLLLGAYKNAADYEDIRVYDYEGLKIAFLSYTYDTNGMTLNAGSQHIIPLISDSDIIRQTARAKEIADLLFVSIHWGNDYSETSWPYGRFDFNPTAEQQRLAQLLSDCGTDVIIGTHPHVVQRMEWMNGKSGNQTLCIYSLGNMISTMHANFNMVGGFLTFDIVVPEEGKPYIDSPLFIPTVTHYQTQPATGTRFGLQVYLLEDYSEELVRIHGSQLRPGGAFTYDTLLRCVSTNLRAAFLPAFYQATPVSAD